MHEVIRHVRRLAARAATTGLTDAQLLEAFLARQDEAAFEGLLRRHGPMVLGVCHRVLRNAHDAEDAFQATFLVLARKAGSLRSRQLLGSWLYGVAYRTAMKARVMSARRRLREVRATTSERSCAPADGPWDVLLEHLDTELNALPDKYRLPVVLCELEGKGRREAARLLNLPEGTLSWRLAYARKLLARRLSRHGAVLPAGGLLAVLSEGQSSACVSASMLAAVTKASVLAAAGRPLVAGMVSAHVVSLTEGMLKTMLLSKLKVCGAVLLALSLSGGVGLQMIATAADPPPTPAKRLVARSPLQDELEALRLEIEALRKDLQATRSRVKVLEEQVQTAQAPQQKPNSDVYLDQAKSKLAILIQDKLLQGAQPSEPRPSSRPPVTAAPPVTAPAPAATPRMATKILKENTEMLQGKVLLLGEAKALTEAEAALKKLRQSSNDEQTLDVLERALKQIREGKEAGHKH